MLNTILRTGQAVILGTLLLHDARAQNAAPAERNAVNSAARPGGMMADSPVTFPKEGALPSKYPKAKIDALVYVRRGGGCQHYKEEGRVAKYILPRKPNLVYIGGISQKDIASIREVIHQLRVGLPEVEILLATGTFGTADPRDAAVLAAAPHSGTGAYGQALKELAGAEHGAYLAQPDRQIVPLQQGGPVAGILGFGSGAAMPNPTLFVHSPWVGQPGATDPVNFAPDVKCPVIIGLGLRDYGLSPPPGIIAAYAYLSGERAIVASPWEGHCYPPKFQQLQATAWDKHIAAKR